MTKKSIFLIGVALLAGGCGDAADRLSRERAALQESVNRRETEFGPLAGRYEGTLSDFDGGNARRVTLVLVPMILIVQNPGQNDVSEVATLGGGLNLVLEGEDGDELLPIAQFTVARFEPESGRLRLSGAIQTASSSGPVVNSLDATIEGTRLKGQVLNSSRGSLGWLDVVREAQP
ncbi:MAG: hypothetical protein NDJ90_03410 [Oligoflexia bacterium]|nr:hypothetical protein [Oligoflexia bacterium]